MMLSVVMLAMTVAAAPVLDDAKKSSEGFNIAACLRSGTGCCIACGQKAKA